MSGRFKMVTRCLAGLAGLVPLIAAIGLAMAFSPRLASGGGSDDKVIAKGGGTTIIHGGTGAPGFVPVLTTVAFHAERTGGSVEGVIATKDHVTYWDAQAPVGGVDANRTLFHTR